jgi:hypothetical protein
MHGEDKIKFSLANLYQMGVYSSKTWELIRQSIRPTNQQKRIKIENQQATNEKVNFTGVRQKSERKRQRKMDHKSVG